jgi:uncharacterized protein YpmB
VPEKIIIIIIIIIIVIIINVNTNYMDSTNSELEISRVNSSMTIAKLKPFLLMQIQRC